MDDRDGQARLDAALVERAVHGADPRAFEVLVRRHQGLVRAQLRRLLGHDAAMADDLAQETFVLAWRKLAQFRSDSRFSTWLYRIAYSCFLQFLRSQGSQAQSVPLDPDAGHAADADPRDLALNLDLTAALQQLPVDQRAALLYCVQLGLSHQEAAEVLDMPLGTVKTHVTRGKARLRELLRDWAPNKVQGSFP
jgi:RNA polymerase sigma factor (sigma-70 family)